MLSVGNEYGQCTDEGQRQLCSAWLTAAHNAIHRICTDPETPYRKKVDKVVSRNHGLSIYTAVGEIAAVLRALLIDADRGLLASVADRARAETFDDFLDHAEAYVKDDRKNEAGAIAGVVFEDLLRRISTKVGLVEKDAKLDALISGLAARGELTAVKAKRARAAADVRTKATHAQWSEFELADVQATITFTRELIASKLDS
ncbi:MAG: hypothetical protein ABI856_12405 [Nitrospira sp.]